MVAVATEMVALPTDAIRRLLTIGAEEALGDEFCDNGSK
jgi:hypothetical protein